MPTFTRSTAIASATAALACASFPQIARAQATAVRVAGVYSDLFAEPFYAKESGAFAKQGFDVQASSLVNAGAVAAALGGGALEMGTGDLVSGVNAILAGVPIVLVAGGGLYIEKTDQPAVILAVAADSPIQKPQDLAGKTIGAPTLVGMTTACMRSWLSSHGVPENGVKFVEVPTPTVAAALARGTIDAAMLSEPFVTFAKNSVRAIGYPYDVAADRAPAKAFCVSVWYAAKAWFEADPGRAKRAVEAIYGVARWANTHHDETFNILVRDGHLDPERAKGMLRMTYATALTPEYVQPILDVAYANKLINRQVEAHSIITKV
jgi:NitT/TauT family transport system substrate-binding protein